MSEPAIEWKDAATHRSPKWPLLGYAPGDYMGRCIKCEGRFTNMDKRAFHCLPCAIEAVGDILADARMKTREIETENATLRSAIQIVSPATAIRQQETP